MITNEDLYNNITTRCNQLNTSAYQETLANAIVAGIKRYYSVYN